MSRAVVTGATGHLGANLVRALLAEGWDVRVVTQEPLEVSPPALAGLDVDRAGATSTTSDRSSARSPGATSYSMLPAISRSRPATKSDSCPLTSTARRAPHRRARGQGLAPRARELGARVKRVPQDSQVDELRRGADTTDAPAYDRSKATGERLVRLAATRRLDAVVVNPTVILGPCDFRPSHMGRTLVDIWTRRLPGVVHGGFDWVDAVT